MKFKKYRLKKKKKTSPVIIVFTKSDDSRELEFQRIGIYKSSTMANLELNNKIFVF